MKRYFFNFFGRDTRKLEWIIDLIERTYRIEYMESRDFKPPLSFSHFLSLNNNWKQIVFNGELSNVRALCKECNFPVDLSYELGNKHRTDILCCFNCSNTVLTKESNGFFYPVPGNTIEVKKT